MAVTSSRSFCRLACWALLLRHACPALASGAPAAGAAARAPGDGSCAAASAAAAAAARAPRDGSCAAAEKGEAHGACGEEQMEAVEEVEALHMVQRKALRSSSAKPALGAGADEQLDHPPRQPPAGPHPAGAISLTDSGANRTAAQDPYQPLGGGPGTFGQVADTEGDQLLFILAPQYLCETYCGMNPSCNSFVWCSFGGCYLKTGKFFGGESTHALADCQTFFRPIKPPAVHNTICEKGTEPVDGECGEPTEPVKMTFYQYSAQKKPADDRDWENLDLANLGGVMFYLHNEVVVKTGEMKDPVTDVTTMKFGVDRVLRFKVTVMNTKSLFKEFKSQFGQFIQFDYGQATFGMPDQVAKCNAIWEKFGYEVGCQPVPLGVSGYDTGFWTSFPGKCPSMPFTADSPQGGAAKTAECMQRQPGGRCDDPDGSPDCTWSITPAGYVTMDEFLGQNLSKFYAGGGHQYDLDTDKGEGMSFWDGKKDKEACKVRQEKLLALFAMKYPDLPASYLEPNCDFWR